MTDWPQQMVKGTTSQWPDNDIYQTKKTTIQLKMQNSDLTKYDDMMTRK